MFTCQKWYNSINRSSSIVHYRRLRHSISIALHISKQYSKQQHRLPHNTQAGIAIGCFIAVLVASGLARLWWKMKNRVAKSSSVEAANSLDCHDVYRESDHHLDDLPPTYRHQAHPSEVPPKYNETASIHENMNSEVSETLTTPTLRT